LLALILLLLPLPLSCDCPLAGLLYAGSLWLSNTSYLYLSVSFIQMTKSLMPGLVYACGVVVGTEKFQGAIALNMVLIAFGVLVCAVGEVNLVFIGLAEQLTALGFEVGDSSSSSRSCCSSGRGGSTVLMSAIGLAASDAPAAALDHIEQQWLVHCLAEGAKNCRLFPGAG
jgi:hypothetical protein